MNFTKMNNILKYGANFPNLHRAVIFHYDPLTEVVDVRSMYSEDRGEVYMWLEEKMKLYTQLGIDCRGYVDQQLFFECGDVTKYFKEG